MLFFGFKTLMTEKNGMEQRNYFRSPADCNKQLRYS
jgi:hypothetical protein